MKWITFSRKMGTQGTEVAKRVASGLGYPLYDTKAINHMAEELGILGSVREVDEKVPSMLHRVFSHAPMVYLERLYSVIYELARQGNAVFLGRGSHILLRDFPCALHVRVTASPETCVRTLMNQGLNRDAAARAIKRSDDERSAFVKFAFGVDWENPERYDLVLNMDKLTVNLAVATVLHMARSSEISEASAEAVTLLGNHGPDQSGGGRPGRGGFRTRTLCLPVRFRGGAAEGPRERQLWTCRSGKSRPRPS